MESHSWCNVDKAWTLVLRRHVGQVSLTGQGSGLGEALGTDLPTALALHAYSSLPHAEVTSVPVSGLDQPVLWKTEKQVRALPDVSKHLSVYHFFTVHLPTFYVLLDCSVCLTLT